MIIRDPVNGRPVHLELDKSVKGIAEYYRVPQSTLENIKKEFNLSLLDIIDIHVSCLIQSFHVTIKFIDFSFHIGVRPHDRDSKEMHFWPLSDVPDHLRTSVPNIFNALYYVIDSIFKMNQDIPDKCGGNLEELREIFNSKPKNKYIIHLVTPSKLPVLPRTPLRKLRPMSLFPGDSPTDKKPFKPRTPTRKSMNKRFGYEEEEDQEDQENQSPIRNFPELEMDFGKKINRLKRRLTRLKKDLKRLKTTS